MIIWNGWGILVVLITAVFTVPSASSQPKSWAATPRASARARASSSAPWASTSPAGS